MEESTNAVEVLSRVMRDDPGYYAAACVAEADVPGTQIRAGDVVIYDAHLDAVVRHASHRYPLPRREYAAFRRAVEAGTVPVVSGGFEEGQPARPERGAERLLAYLAQPGARRGRDETSRIYVARPLRSPVSTVIAASSDDAALFELLAQVGGRLPAEDGR